MNLHLQTQWFVSWLFIKSDRTSLEDDPGDECSKSALTSKNKAKNIGYDFGRLSIDWERFSRSSRHLIRQFSDTFSVLFSVCAPLLCTIWVPNWLTVKLIHIRMRYSQQHLEHVRKH